MTCMSISGCSSTGAAATDAQSGHTKEETMTIRDKDAATLYTAMSDERRPRPPKVRRAAQIADAAWDDLRAHAETAGMKVPNDDRAENVVHAMFRSICEANGMDVAILAKVVRETEEYAV